MILHFQGWHLNRVLVVDCQTGAKHPFIVDRWLAVDEEDGLIERMVPISGEQELTNFATLFSHRTKNQLSDGHLWCAQGRSQVSEGEQVQTQKSYRSPLVIWFDKFRWGGACSS